MSARSCLWIPQGVCSTSGNIMCMYRSNFNMPVPDLFDGSSNCTNGWMAARYVDMCDTSHALSGTWYAGYEFALGDSMYIHNASSSCINGVGCVTEQWKVDGNDINFASYELCIDLDEGFYGWTESMVNTGIAGWEIDQDSTVTFTNQITNVSGDDVSIAAHTGTIILACVPDTTQCSTILDGSIWVEGNTLGLINANGFKHYIVGNCCGSGASAGAVWIDNSHYLNWANSGGCWYRAPWRICQFCSTFSNGAGPNPSPGASYAGAIWADTEFGWTHLAYIGCDGNKYLAGAGDYPYS